MSAGARVPPGMAAPTGQAHGPAQRHEALPSIKGRETSTLGMPREYREHGGIDPAKLPARVPELGRPRARGVFPARRELRGPGGLAKLPAAVSTRVPRGHGTHPQASSTAVLSDGQHHSSWRKRLRTLAHVALAAAPSFIKLPVYRHLFGFGIAPGVKIGCSVLDVEELSLARGARIGHANILTGTKRVVLGVESAIDHLNIVRGGDEVVLEDYAWVMRLNVLNSIPDNDCETATDPRLHIKKGACIVSGHRLDFTDRIELGTNVIVAGRNSSFWTHNRQFAKAIRIGDFCYLGSEVRLGPGAELGAFSILAMGAVLAKPLSQERVLAGGVPAKVIRAITAEDERRLLHKTRRTIPDDAY